MIARLTKIVKNSKGGLGSTIHWKKSPVSVAFKTSSQNCPDHCINPDLGMYYVTLFDISS